MCKEITAMQIIKMILSLLSGVALFLYGMSLMGDGLKSVAGNKLETFLYKMTNTPFKGILLGTGVTSVIQSSAATTVMVIGFVNSGMMKLHQAMGPVSFVYSRLQWDRGDLILRDHKCGGGHSGYSAADAFQKDRP